MTTIAVDADKVTLAQLLDRVEPGQSAEITQGGNRLGTITREAAPLDEEKQRVAREAFERLFAFREKLRSAGYAMTFAEFKEARDEGRP